MEICVNVSFPVLNKSIIQHTPKKLLQKL